MVESRAVVFLCASLADYFHSSIRALLKENVDLRAVLICHNRDPDAPYIFEHSDRMAIHSREEFTNSQEMLDCINTNDLAMLYVCGWFDKTYVKVAEKLYGQIPTVIGVDNPWLSTVRQNIGVFTRAHRIRACFSHVWCAGEPQVEFARKLGFERGRITDGLYVANLDAFHSEYESRNFVSDQRTLLFVGRYVDYKNPILLANAFKQLERTGETNNWKLRFVGAGEKYEMLKKYECHSITVSGFVAPNELPELFSNSSAFCLPSVNEHWGVVVQEAAGAGLPLILSDSVYSGTAFLREGENGWSFPAGDKEALLRSLRELFSLNNVSLSKMGERSYQLSSRFSSETWNKNITAFLSCAN